MSNIEKIRQEIERLMRETNDTQFEIGKRYMCCTILDFIDTLLEEKPSEDLEEAAKDFVWEVMENDEDGISDLCRKLRPSSKISDFYDALGEFFIAGAEWGIKSQEKKIADAYEKGKQEGIRVVRSWESSPGQGGY